MLWLRKIVFYVFAIIYLILCPLLVARMLGFVVNPLTYRLVKTGLVYISTNPPDATVYMDGRPAHQKTPTAIRDLAPGEHFIRIELSGYNDWERTIPVVGKKATVLANTLLIPEEWPVKRISRQSYQNIIRADDDILIATNPVLKNIDIFHTTQGIEENFNEDNTYGNAPLFSENSIYAEGSLVHLFHEPLSPFVLLEAAINDKHKFLWIDLKENPPVIEDISDLFSEIPNLITWDNADNDNIFAFSPTHVYRINIKNKEVSLQDDSLLPESLRRKPSDRIQDNFLINAGTDFLIRQGRQIRIYPKEEFGKPRGYDIATSMPSANMYFEEKNGELFYLDGNGGFLSAAQILPYHPILDIPIPDTLRFTGSKKEPGL